MSIERKDIKYIPKEIYNLLEEELNENSDVSVDDANAVADKLLSHLAIIKDYYDRLDSIDYLCDNAEKMAKNPTYKTNDNEIIESISALGGSYGVVDFELFKKSIDIIIQSFENMAVGSLSGVFNV